MSEESRKTDELKSGEKPWVKVVLALITGLVAITVAVIANQPKSDFTDLKAGPTESQEKNETQNQSVSLVGDPKDENDNVVDKKRAPYKVRIRGTALNANGYYVYLVVNDSNAEWVQAGAGLGANIAKDFSGHCFLGNPDDNHSLNKWYEIFAVITNRAYKAQEHLDRGTIKAESSERIRLRRIR